MSRVAKITILVLIVISLVGCGGGAGVKLSGNANCDRDSCGTLKLNVKGANPSGLASDHARLKNFKVTISGTGIEQELTGEFPADAEEGIIEGVPSGEDRRVDVSAININGRTIREGEAEDISVKGGSTSDVDVTLEAVPIFINLVDGSTVENTRLIFNVFSESHGQVVIEDSVDASSDILVDASTSLPEISFNSTTGVGRLAPALVDPGSHKFTARDMSTGRYSSVNLRLLDGSKRKPAPLFSSSDVGSELNKPTRNLGQAIGMSPLLLDFERR